MALTFEIDPTSEDAGNTALTITTAPYRLRDVDLTPPDIDPRYASSVDTEGDLLVANRHRNRHVVLTVMITGADVATNAAFETAMGDLVKKLMKLHREGGTVKMTTPAGTTEVVDVLTVSTKPTLDQLWPVRRIGTVQIDFECKPYSRGTPVQLSDHVETTSPVLVFTEAGAGLTGDVPALGRLMLDNDQASQDQGWLIWGVQSRYYDSAASAALFYEAEGRTVQGGATAVAGPTGASGAGSNVVRITNMPASPISMLSTQATGGGAHLSHVGTFRVYARVQTASANASETNIALEWGTGDLLRSQLNATTTIPTTWGGGWRLIDLGLVSIPKIVSGTQRWEGRVAVWGATAAGGQIDLDYLMLVPVDEGSGVVTAVQSMSTPTVLSVRDEFNQTAGALGGKTAAVGGVYTARGTLGGSDLTVDAGNHYVTRTALSDGSFLGRGVTLPVTMTDTIASLDTAAGVVAFSFDSYHMLMARYVDEANFLGVTAAISYTGSFLLSLDLFTTAGGHVILGTTQQGWVPGAWITLRLRVDSAGRVNVWWGPQGGALSLVLTANHSALATGGVLASGLPGFRDARIDPTVARTRYYDNFFAWVGPVDAAVFAQQSLEVRENQVLREDSSGSFWNKPSSYEGDYLRLPPGGKEARTSRFIVKMSRNPPGVGEDSGIDDLSGRLTVIPRYLLLPS